MGSEMCIRDRVCLLTGNINPVCRVTAMLMPVWLAAELRLLCTLL